MRVCVCVIRYFSDLCHNACKSIKCDKQEEEEEEEEEEDEPHSSPAKNLAQCVRLFVMGSQTHFNFICDALRTNTQTEGQTDKQDGSGRGGGDGRAYQSQINEM